MYTPKLKKMTGGIKTSVQNISFLRKFI